MKVGKEKKKKKKKRMMVKLIQNGWAKWSFIKTQKIMHLFTILCFNYLTLFKKKKISMSHVALSLSLSPLFQKP